MLLPLLQLLINRTVHPSSTSSKQSKVQYTPTILLQPEHPQRSITTPPKDAMSHSSCPKCGAGISGSSKTCSSCGSVCLSTGLCKVCTNDTLTDTNLVLPGLVLPHNDSSNRVARKIGRVKGSFLITEGAVACGDYV